MNQQQRLPLDAPVFPCPECDRGRVPDRETGSWRTCQCCGGMGHVDWQPSTTSDPFENMETIQ